MSDNQQEDVVFEWKPAADVQPPGQLSHNQNPYAAPTAALTHGAPAITGELASRGERLAATIIDGLSYFLCAIPFGLAVEFDQTAVGVAIGGILLIGLVVLNVQFLTATAQTIGKRLVGIHITRTDGSHPSLSRLLFLRSAVIGLISMIPLLGSLVQLADILMIFGEERLCLHDRIADTKVLRGTPGTSADQRPM